MAIANHLRSENPIRQRLHIVGPSRQQRISWLAGRSLLPYTTVGWGGEFDEKGETCVLGQRRFDGKAKEEKNNNNNTDKKNVQSEGYTAQFS